jgi:transposase
VNIARYLSSLTYAQWSFIEPMLPKPKKRGRPLTDRRKIIEAIFYILKGGVQWRMLPSGLPSVADGLSSVPKMERRECIGCAQQSIACPCQRCPRQTIPLHAVILDSQSVKSDPHGGSVGYDAGKRIKGRKRHILVNTLGLLLGGHITPASTADPCGAKELLSGVLQWFSWLRNLWVDGGYSGQPFADWVKEQRPKLKVEVVKRSNDMEGFEALP